MAVEFAYRFDDYKSVHLNGNVDYSKFQIKSIKM